MPQKVSIVMPTYNRQDLLPKTISTILSQSYKDFELLIVDDGSIDETANVINLLKQRDNRIRFLQLPRNRGLGYARDIGLQYTTGTYVALADQDDLWIPGKLQKQVKVMELYQKIDILFSDFINIDHVSGKTENGFDQFKNGMSKLKVRREQGELHMVESGVEAGMLIEDFFNPPTMIMRRSVFQKVGGYNRGLMHTDHEFCWRAALLGAKFAYLNVPLVERHRYHMSITGDIVGSVHQKLKCCRLFRQLCERENKKDLIPFIRRSEERAWCNLIRHNAINGSRLDVYRAYTQSLGWGMSEKIVMFFILALCFGNAIDWVFRLKARIG